MPSEEPGGLASEPRHPSALEQVERRREGSPQRPGRSPQSAAAASPCGLRGIVLLPRGDGPAECDGADPEAEGRAADGREETECLPRLPTPEARGSPKEAGQKGERGSVLL